LPFIGEIELTKKIADANRRLAERNIKLEILPNTFRDYQVQFELMHGGLKKGRGIVYYSPKKQSFRLKVLQTSDEFLEDALDAAFGGEKPKTEVAAYVDGSFASGTASYGAVILKGGKVVAELSGVLPPDEAASHQIGGELRGALEVLKWAEKNGCSEITICYDYKGVEKFATDSWKRENPLAERYYQEVRKSRVKVHWQKIAAHTGVKWNERADELARQAARENPTEAALPRAEQLVQKFEDLLTAQGLEYENKGLFNNQFVRLVVQGKKPVYFDLYDTPKRQLDPYIHGGDKELVEELGRLFDKLKKS